MIFVGVFKVRRINNAVFASIFRCFVDIFVQWFSYNNDILKKQQMNFGIFVSRKCAASTVYPLVFLQMNLLKKTSDIKVACGETCGTWTVILIELMKYSPRNYPECPQRLTYIPRIFGEAS